MCMQADKMQGLLEPVVYMYTLHPFHVFSDAPVGRRVSPRVHAGPVGAGEAESVAHSTWSRGGRTRLQSGCGGKRTHNTDLV